MDRERRFGSLGRLYGPAALARFRAAHVCVIGIGGVGSWIVEALSRSAIGTLTLIDLDHVAESNINRQVHADSSTLGKAKIEAMAERIAAINPECKVNLIDEFVDPANVAELISPGRFDVVVDAIDSVKAKVALIVHCRAHGIPLLTIGAAGGQVDPTRVRVDDLAFTQHEPLLARVRKKLRAAHGFPRHLKTRFGIDAVYSEEPLVYPAEVCEVGADGTTNGVTGLNCAGFGSVVAVTGVFGFVAAAQVLRRLAAQADGAPAAISGTPAGPGSDVSAVGAAQPVAAN